MDFPKCATILRHKCIDIIVCYLIPLSDIGGLDIHTRNGLVSHQHPEKRAGLLFSTTFFFFLQDIIDMIVRTIL